MVLNLFAFRATDPDDLKRATDPVGPENQEWFIRSFRGLSEEAIGPVVCGWGVHGSHRGQDEIVIGWLERLGIAAMALGMTKDRHPRHPLYAPYSTDLIPFSR